MYTISSLSDSHRRSFPRYVSAPALYEPISTFINCAQNNPVQESSMSEEACFMRRKYSCHKCGNTYKRKSHFNRHVNLECGMEPQFCCPCCPNRYRRKSTLRYHIRRHHGTHLSLSNTFWRLDIFVFSTHAVFCKLFLCWLSKVSVSWRFKSWGCFAG